MARGYTTFRIAFLMERLAPPGTGLKGNFDATYLAALKTVRNSFLFELKYWMLIMTRFRHTSLEKVVMRFLIPTTLEDITAESLPITPVLVPSARPLRRNSRPTARSSSVSSPPQDSSEISKKVTDNRIIDTNNEYHDMDQTLVFNLNQACINGIRAAGATSQLILVEGNSYTGAWTWYSSCLIHWVGFFY